MQPRVKKFFLKSAADGLRFDTIDFPPSSVEAESVRRRAASMLHHVLFRFRRFRVQETLLHFIQLDFFLSNNNDVMRTLAQDSGYILTPF